MARLIAALIRHGDYHQLPGTPSAHQPFALSPRGVCQARAAAEQMKQSLRAQGWQPLAEIDSSMLLRAWQTAQLFADELAELFTTSEAGQVVTFEALAERGLGSAANLTSEQILQVMRDDPRYPLPPPDWKSNSHYRLPLQGAESLMEAGQRVADHLQARMAALPRVAGETRVKLFVGHGAAFRHAAHLLGVLAFEDIARLSMHHAQPVYLEYDAQGRWQQVAGNWKIREQASLYTD